MTAFTNSIPDVSSWRQVAHEPLSAQDLCIYRLLESQAKRTPDAIAIAAPGRASLA